MNHSVLDIVFLSFLPIAIYGAMMFINRYTGNFFVFFGLYLIGAAIALYAIIQSICVSRRKPTFHLMLIPLIPIQISLAYLYLVVVVIESFSIIGVQIVPTVG